MQVNNPSAAGASLTVSETEVFSGTSPNPSAWTDLDISAVVGSNVALVLLKILNPDGGAQAVGFRVNGDADESFDTANRGMSSNGDVGNGKYAYAVVATDSSGILEWRFEAVDIANITIDVVAFIV